MVGFDYDSWKATDRAGEEESQPCLWCAESLQQARPFCNQECEASWEQMQMAAREMPTNGERVDQ